MLMNLRADYHDTPDPIRLAHADLILDRNYITIDPSALHVLTHALGPKNIVRLPKSL